MSLDDVIIIKPDGNILVIWVMSTHEKLINYELEGSPIRKYVVVNT